MAKQMERGVERGASKPLGVIKRPTQGTFRGSPKGTQGISARYPLGRAAGTTRESGGQRGKLQTLFDKLSEGSASKNVSFGQPASFLPKMGTDTGEEEEESAQ
eukprot:scaffold85014_cov36-Tisochrysis_lutea.AAC.5